MQTSKQGNLLIEYALRLAEETACDKVFLFLNSEKECHSYSDNAKLMDNRVVLILPRHQQISDCFAGLKTVIHTWSGNQTRFSRIKYAFMQAVLQDVIQPHSKVVCVLGPWGRDHLDTVTIHDLRLSWSEDFPFDPRSLIGKKFYQTVIAVVDIALDIGALGREGKSVGATFIIGNIDQVMNASHQAIFNPFKGYAAEDRLITSPEVVESIKELALLDGAFVISDTGVVEAAGRYLDAVSNVTHQLKGLGSRHRAAASMTMHTEAIAVVVSEGTGRLTVFDQGKIIASLEPVVSTRVV